MLREFRMLPGQVDQLTLRQLAVFLGAQQKESGAELKARKSKPSPKSRKELEKFGRAMGAM